MSLPNQQNTIDNQAVAKVSAGEERVIKQLVEALLFERLVHYEYKGGFFYFTIGNNRYKSKGLISSFDRIRLDDIQKLIKPSNFWLNISLEDIINDLDIDTLKKEQLQSELTQTLFFCDWNQQNISQESNRRHLPYIKLETAIREGHSYHPSFKARLGFTIDDHIKYSPDTGNIFQLNWIAIIRNKTRVSLSPKFNEEQTTELFWQAELGKSTWTELQTRLRQYEVEQSNYELMPIHPWQWQHLRPKLSEQLNNKEIVYLGQAGDDYVASISIRSLFNITHTTKASIKLPLNIINSSSLRTIDNHSINSAPYISRWLRHLIDTDHFLLKKDNIDILCEYAGISLAADGSNKNNWVHALKNELGVIFRESIEHKYHDKDKVPFVSLALMEGDKKPFIHHWITEYGCEQWVAQLIETCVIPIWHLLVQHGIALETHAQNLILIHHKGWPQKIVIKDFHESLEYVRSYLANPEKEPNFYQVNDCYHHAKPNQYYWMDSLEALRELFVDTLFIFNLTELSFLLEKEYGFKEDYFWRLVYQSIKSYTKENHTHIDRIKKIDIFSQRIQTESLLTKKISDQSCDEFHHTINNSLHSC